MRCAVLVNCTNMAKVLSGRMEEHLNITNMGHAGGQCNLGFLYATGHALWTASAAQGSETAIKNLKYSRRENEKQQDKDRNEEHKITKNNLHVLHVTCITLFKTLTLTL